MTKRLGMNFFKMNYPGTKKEPQRIAGEIEVSHPKNRQTATTGS